MEKKMNTGSDAGLKTGKPTRDAFGEALKALGAENDRIVVVDGDVSNSTRTQAFGEAYPNRFFNVGIAESNMVSIASGISACGKTALVSSFACFLLNNAYEQIRMGVAFPNQNVKLVGSHSGISIGEDGPSQMAIEDIALATSFPNMTVIVPADEPSTHALTRAMLDHVGPVYFRTGRPAVPIVYTGQQADWVIGKANQLVDGTDLTIIACGIMVAAALDAAEQLRKRNIQACVIDMHTIKPLDREVVEKAARETGAIVTAEEHSIQGGLGDAISREVVTSFPVPVEHVAIQDRYARSGSPEALLKLFGLTAADIVKAADRVITRKIRSTK
jgi:transketolase